MTSTMEGVTMTFDAHGRLKDDASKAVETVGTNPIPEGEGHAAP